MSAGLPRVHQTRFFPNKKRARFSNKIAGSLSKGGHPFQPIPRPMSDLTPPPVWWNGQLLPESEAHLSVQSQGWLWGRGLFETIAIRDNQALALTRHLARLHASAPRLGLQPPDESTLRDAIAAVLADCPPTPHRLRLTLTGAEAPGLDLTPTPGQLLIRRQPMESAQPAEPAILLTVPWRRNEFSPLSGIKSTSYAENAIALAHVKERDATEALFLNTAGDLCEGAVSNLFLIKDENVFT
ncbi:MAG: aminotransferase class, partial [Verrucomicrobiales bacterium]|nr:aminotransferase class [Verrucomicrobiales bacterium]